MGKKQHQKDKLYLTTQEWRYEFGGHKDSLSKKRKVEFKRLPFSHCSLSLVPYTIPVCCPEGYLFDYETIVNYLKDNKINPCTGKKLSIKDIVKLNFTKDKKGNQIDPVKYKPFTENSTIACIRQSGNVYDLETIQELSYKTGWMKDPQTDVPFQKKDVIILQNPNNIDKFNIESFLHVKNDEKKRMEIEKEKNSQKGDYFLNSVSCEAQEALKELEKEYSSQKPLLSIPKQIQVVDKFNSANYSQGKVAAGFTSTAFDPITENKAAILDDETVKYKLVTSNGYVKILTNVGHLNLELYCKAAPKTCENFITHCENGYYDNTIFHRLIRYFLIQGGDPTGTGRGGQSIWGKPFANEIGGDNGYTHSERGMISMANKGVDCTNQSQFFIIFRPMPSLNGKNTVFGKVVGGTDTLKTMEETETDGETPKIAIKILSTDVIKNPFKEAEEQLRKERFEMTDEGKRQKEEANKTFKDLHSKVFSNDVGKYINPKLIENIKRKSTTDNNEKPKEKKTLSSKPYSDFSSW
ncbi:Peptidyl-prolyl cis-trans isomerase-like 2 [Strongyloides ratti]|uniref:Peptidyl-prolyl cis-trans isomerase-like 2 n=1 Tax=Strongyloides ratti TaxID=34506 RepID=A0A090L8Z7_STRRB|nr:Peptidyl-prolyl cis-trans isomerase-like 2 [Strongyloides ratti]CEF64000.1 Peptidyl-prolyl cis-trans isomerase-like 2 [Strongyloides ratti]